MPRLIKSARAKPGSNSPANPPPKAAPASPQFTESQQSPPPDGPYRPEKTPEPAEWLSPEKLSLDATEPFPDSLFRVPVPNAVFGRMPEMSDSALRCLLALIHLSFRFDPAEGEWVHTEDWFNRSDVEDECGLSNQGTRDGLNELDSMGWTCVDRSGRSHWYQLELKVPSQQFTYVPTALLESASDVGSGTELRVVLAVLRETWGWTCKETHSETDPQSGRTETVHDRWAQLSNRKLAEATGRSETAVGGAAQALQGRWIERVRPGNGAYQYRFLPEAVGNESEDKKSGPRNTASRDTTNDLAPDRQKSGTPTYSKESSSKDKHSQPQKKESSKPSGPCESEVRRAMPTDNDPEREPGRQKQKTANKQGEEALTPNFSDLPTEKQELAKKLANVGVWAGRIAELLTRFSSRRIRANFELYRRRAAEQTIRNPGAWLYEAITDGYALPDAESGTEGSVSTEESGPRPTPGHKEVVSEARKETYVAGGIDEERFHRCLSSGGSSSEPKFMYFAPEKGGPERRVR